MNSLNPQEIRTALDQRRKRDRERMRREEEAMDAVAIEVVESLTAGVRGMADDRTSVRLDPSSDSAPGELLAATGTDARRAIEARRQRPASSRPAPVAGEPPLRAALRGIVADYAAPIRPSKRIVADLQALSGIALDEADTHGLWADLELAQVHAVRAAMRDVVDIVTDRAETVIIAELVAAREHLAIEYPDVPIPADASEEPS
jgi:hypothetical protein